MKLLNLSLLGPALLLTFAPALSAAPARVCAPARARAPGPAGRTSELALAVLMAAAAALLLYAGRHLT